MITLILLILELPEPVQVYIINSLVLEKTQPSNLLQRLGRAGRGSLQSPIRLGTILAHVAHLVAVVATGLTHIASWSVPVALFSRS